MITFADALEKANKIASKQKSPYASHIISIGETKDLYFAYFFYFQHKNTDPNINYHTLYGAPGVCIIKQSGRASCLYYGELFDLIWKADIVEKLLSYLEQKLDMAICLGELQKELFAKGNEGLREKKVLQIFIENIKKLPIAEINEKMLGYEIWYCFPHKKFLIDEVMFWLQKISKQLINLLGGYRCYN
jgi:hypothetical protein